MFNLHETGFSVFRAYKSIVSVMLIVVFALSSVLGYAQPTFVRTLPQPGSMVSPSASFVPVLMRGLVIHPDEPLRLDFLVDAGQDSLDADGIAKESERMAQYFLAAVTVPEQELWVNLSPYEKDRIIERRLGSTILGRDLLSQDYVLKQFTASLLYPEKGLGQEFWTRIYEAAQQKFGTTDIPVDTFNKVWIMPAEAEIVERGTKVYVTKARLKVMLDCDRTAMKANAETTVSDEKSALAKELMREIIIPAIEREVNEGKNFATMRQIYYAAILAKWYRQLIKDTLLGSAYVGQNKVSGIEAQEKALKAQIYARYIEAYQKGVFHYIKEESSLTSREMIPRKYFSGGVLDLAMQQVPLKKSVDAAGITRVGPIYRVPSQLSNSGQQNAVDAMAMMEVLRHIRNLEDPSKKQVAELALKRKYRSALPEVREVIRSAFNKHGIDFGMLSSSVAVPVLSKQSDNGTDAAMLDSAMGDAALWMGAALGLSAIALGYEFGWPYYLEQRYTEAMKAGDVAGLQWLLKNKKFKKVQDILFDKNFLYSGKGQPAVWEAMFLRITEAERKQLVGIVCDYVLQSPGFWGEDKMLYVLLRNFDDPLIRAMLYVENFKRTDLLKIDASLKNKAFEAWRSGLDVTPYTERGPRTTVIRYKTSKPHDKELEQRQEFIRLLGTAAKTVQVGVDSSMMKNKLAGTVAAAIGIGSPVALFGNGELLMELAEVGGKISLGVLPVLLAFEGWQKFTPGGDQYRAERFNPDAFKNMVREKRFDAIRFMIFPDDRESGKKPEEVESEALGLRPYFLRMFSRLEYEDRQAMIALTCHHILTSPNYARDMVVLLALWTEWESETKQAAQYVVNMKKNLQSIQPEHRRAALREVLAGKRVQADSQSETGFYVNGVLTAEEKVRHDELLGLLQKRAGQLDAAAVNGGIDIQNIDVTRKPGGALVKFNDESVRALMDNDFPGLMPVILEVVPVEVPIVSLFSNLRG